MKIKENPNTRYTIEKKTLRSRVRASLGWVLGRGYVKQTDYDRYVINDTVHGRICAVSNAKGKSSLELVAVNLNRYEWIRREGIDWFMKELTVRLNESLSGRTVSTHDLNLIRQRACEVFDDMLKEGMNHGK